MAHIRTVDISQDTQGSITGCWDNQNLGALITYPAVSSVRNESNDEFHPPLPKVVAITLLLGVIWRDENSIPGRTNGEKSYCTAGFDGGEEGVRGCAPTR